MMCSPVSSSTVSFPDPEVLLCSRRRVAFSDVSARWIICVRKCSPASWVAFPETKAWREADVFPASAVKSVSPITYSNCEAGSPRASAQIWTIIVFAPWPISIAPLYKVNLPSPLMPTRIVDGFESEVFPHPYQALPQPTPRLTVMFCWLKSAASLRQLSQRLLSDSKHSTCPTLFSSNWLVGVRSPFRNAFLIRKSSASMPTFSASSSSSASFAIAAWGVPNPRKAPEGDSFVSSARVWASTLGTK